MEATVNDRPKPDHPGASQALCVTQVAKLCPVADKVQAG